MKRDNYGVLGDSSWIGRERDFNPMTADAYTYSCGYRLREGDCAGLIIAARDKDNYLLIEIDHRAERLRFYDVRHGRRSELGAGKERPLYSFRHLNTVEITVRKETISVKFNGRIAADSEEILPKTTSWEPKKNTLMMVGADGRENCIVLNEPVVEVGGRAYRSCGAEQLEIRDRIEIFSISPCLCVRRRISVKDVPESAVLYASARGFYNVYVNGKKAGDEYLAPGFTDYRLRIQYQRYDITDLLRTGENIISAVVAQGYYSGYAGYNQNGGVYGDTASFIARIELNYADGAEVTVTDESWELAECESVISADCLQGEYYDARLETAGIPWDSCRVVPDPTAPVPTNGSVDGLEFSMDEQTYRGAHEIKRISGRLLGGTDRLIFDMGENIAGTVSVRLRGGFGSSVRLRYGEMLDKSGSLYTENLRSAASTDIYILKGASEGEEFCPDLTAHGFRYVEITGSGRALSESGIEIRSVTGIVLSNIDRVTGGFECSNELINRLRENIVRSQIGNCLLVPTDCPQRSERMGWTGDAQVFARTAAYNMDVLEFMRKWLRDLREAQLMYNRDGSVPDIAPLCGDNRGGCGGWADAAVIVPWEMYRAYGDRTILEENYEMMKAWVEFQNSPEHRGRGLNPVCPERSDTAETPYIQPPQRRGDHLAPDDSTPFALTATAYAARSAELLSAVSKILGRDAESEKYRLLHDKIKRAFREAWVMPDGTIAYWGEPSKPEICETRYSDAEGSAHRPSQTAYALAVDFGLIDTGEHPRAAKCFERAVRDFGTRPSVGFLGISHLLPALMKCGLKETAFRLIEQTENPGWLYSVVNGATTIWERWDSYIAETGEFAPPEMNSFNHYAYGAAGEWLFGYVLGIRPLEAGYSRFLLEPNYGGTLKYAKGFHITPAGRIDSAWRLENGEFIYRCGVPEGAAAELILPDGSKHVLGAGEYEFRTEAPR